VCSNGKVRSLGAAYVPGSAAASIPSGRFLPVDARARGRCARAAWRAPSIRLRTARSSRKPTWRSPLDKDGSQYTLTHV
jgi:hypothetical protein